MPCNRLANSTSPYLLQHADNPVDWYPWGAEALSLAEERDVPILLSIGYSACHWCHVMAHESFEDKETADFMNALFVNIKVDREERPDLDKIYQSAHHILTRRPGGWPLTVFLTPGDQTPFFAGTYFPKEPRHGLLPFRELLRRIAAAYREQRTAITEQNQVLREALATLEPSAPVTAETLEKPPIAAAVRQLQGSFDARYGGFGQAPKFPHPESLLRLLNHWGVANTESGKSSKLLHPLEQTLTRMALGGINDQLGGGFYRYSVDEQWMIPHFEKMLYDNGPLLAIYSDIWKATGKELYAATARQTARWVMGEMQSAAGGYYSSLDADSEGEEGRYYLWEPRQVAALLTEQEYALFASYFGLDRPANFEERWHLHRSGDAVTGTEDVGLLESAREKLLREREKRIKPGRDDKILTAWNGLMIQGMARAGRLLSEPEFSDSAERALQFIKQEMWRDGRLLASHKDGVSHLAGYLDDYAYLLAALLELLQSRWQSADLHFAMELADTLLEHFEDREAGGFFFTADDHERLIHRPKPYADESIPAGNGVAARALLLLGHLAGETRYLEAAERTLKGAWQAIQEYPQAHCTLLEALDEYLHPGEIILLRGSGEPLLQWLKRAQSRFSPRRYCFSIPSDERGLPPLLQEKEASSGTVAYICRGTHCEEPVDDFQRFDAILATTEAPGINV
jgi:uncharacterized protein YyaL (SSP411 family)